MTTYCKCCKQEVKLVVVEHVIEGDIEGILYECPNCFAQCKSSEKWIEFFGDESDKEEKKHEHGIQ